MISMLPDNVLLEVFDICRSFDSFLDTWQWSFLVHVCQRWRQVIFASPQRLHLRILCTHRSPVRKNLAIWPPFPIIIYSEGNLTPNDGDNVIAALKHSDRVWSLVLHETGSQLGRVATEMLKPFPILTRLNIVSPDGNTAALPAHFLGGSAPCLKSLGLHGIPFPTLPTLLLSATSLVRLSLEIPPTSYISPEAMVASLAAVPKLETFSFNSHTSRPDRILPPPATRTVLPALTDFIFWGTSEYLEDLLAQIDGPQLDWISIYYQLADFQVGQLSQFFHRSVCQEIIPPKRASVVFSSDGSVIFDLNSASSPHCDSRIISITCEASDWELQVSDMAQVLSQFSATLSTVVHLVLQDGLEYDSEGREDVQWLDFLRQFTSVRTLHVKRGLARDIALALDDLTMGMIAGVLPSLELIYLVGEPESSVEKFVAARRRSGCPVTATYTKAEFEKGLQSYISK